jgi:sec-independent protein translocase protein TatB
MFDIGFSELVVIGIVALVVLGPERMPKAARFAGLWVRRARAQWYSVKAELERELEAEELKRTLQDARQTMSDLDAGMRSASDDARREFETMQAQLRQTAADAQAPALPEPATGTAQDTATPTAAGAPDDRR